MLVIVPSCNPVQHQGKLMIQISENGKNPNFGPQKFLTVRQCSMQFKGKLMNQTWKNCEKPNLGLGPGPFGPYLGPKILFVGFTSTSS